MTPAKRPGRRDRIRAQLADLKLPGALEALDPILSGVDGGRFTAAEAIEKLLAAQIGLRNNRRLPAVKTLADFDFSLAVATAERGRRIYYGALADLITSLEEAQAAGRLQQRLKVLTHPALLIVDEIGYVPLSRTGATLFFQLVNRRYETGSTILTSNQSFEEWGRIFGDEVMATALIDRLLHHCHIVNIRGNS